MTETTAVHGTATTIRDEAELRELLGEPSNLVRAKVTDRLNELTRQFVDRSPFVLLATSAADGSCDVSPRGDPPGFVRVIDEFEYTQTEKILVRNLKKVHFDLNRLGDARGVFWRRRGDKTYKPLVREDYEQLRQEFAAREKLELLDR